MRQCPKCSSKYNDDLNFCQACDAMLETIKEEPLPATDNKLSLHENSGKLNTTSDWQHSWTCTQCGRIEPAEVDACRNCGTRKDSTSDPGFIKPSPENKDFRFPAAGAAPQTVGRRRACHECPRCGSIKIIPGTRIRDRGQNSDIQLYHDAAPEALVFKDRLYSTIIADICGDCGHIELRVEDFKNLYRHYLQSKAD